MPELPEVETTRRGIEPYLLNATITSITVHQWQLRWAIPKSIKQLKNQTINAVNRRGKYILIETDTGKAIVHLGMSGSLRIVTNVNEPKRKHDHVEMQLSNGALMRLHDPRRFGCLLWQAASEPTHSLLDKLGPEPLTDEFDAGHLIEATRKKKVAIKNLIMNSHIVVGVGNIYASEALFMAGIRPGRAAGRITYAECSKLVEAIKIILQQSIDQGGTTLRDFVNSDGEPGYFKQSLFVYGKEGEDCQQCGNAIKQKILGQRSTFYCVVCQK